MEFLVRACVFLVVFFGSLSLVPGGSSLGDLCWRVILSGVERRVVVEEEEVEKGREEEGGEDRVCVVRVELNGDCVRVRHQDDGGKCATIATISTTTSGPSPSLLLTSYCFSSFVGWSSQVPSCSLW